jgi:hypothetical protein
MSTTYPPIRLKPNVKNYLKVLFVQFIAVLLLFSLTAFNQIETSSQIILNCRDGQPFIEVTGWSQGGPLLVIVDGEEIGQITLSADTGVGSFSFGQSDQQYEVLLLNLDSMPIAAGSLNCTNQPLGFTNLSITPTEITLTAGSTLQFTATGEDNSGSETEVNPIWISEKGAITKEGIFSRNGNSPRGPATRTHRNRPPHGKTILRLPDALHRPWIRFRGQRNSHHPKLVRSRRGNQPGWMVHRHVLG